ncbi:protein-tyrosine phosphatase family protein [Nocardioides nanhaiensis]|uniref:Protein-tyrosine phosphatase family protein n=1 Tax=Nocardioides nanhaiensis TaxID=1476871 RepID=A0ABP8VZ25_9ACTN
MPGWPDDAPGVVVLPDGRRVRAAPLHAPRAELPEPQLHLVLLGREPDPLPWPVHWVRWPDFRSPADTATTLAALREAHAHALTERVEVSCRGGVGRTGTALAALAVLSGLPPGEAVAWVREHHHPRAVETPLQRRWLRQVAARLGPGLSPPGR